MQEATLIPSPLMKMVGTKKKQQNLDCFIYLETINGDKLNKSEKQKFRFSNLFTTK